MSPQRSLLALLSVLLAFALRAEPALHGPDRLRPGDPLLLWVASMSEIEGGRLELLSPSGRLLASVPLFAYSELPPAAEREPLVLVHPEAEILLAAETRPGPSPKPLLYEALIGLPLELAAGSYGLRLSGKEGGAAFYLPRLLEIEARDFPSEDIGLGPANTALRTLPDPVKEAESRALQALYARKEPEARFLDAGFLLPVGEARRSAGFGDRRRYLYAGGGIDTTSHYGIDFAVPVGTQVLAPARGRVVFADARIVTGKTLVIEHLPGLYTVFMHLSELQAKAGTMVERGDPVARSGNTGLSTGPHLHWELRASGLAVDPEYWVNRAPLDTEWEKTAIFSPAFEGR